MVKKFLITISIPVIFLLFTGFLYLNGSSGAHFTSQKHHYFLYNFKGSGYEYGNSSFSPDSTTRKKGKEEIPGEKTEKEREYNPEEDSTHILSSKDSTFKASSDTTRLDSLIKYDTLAQDSSARLSQFNYKRSDLLRVPLFQKRSHPFFLKSPTGIIERIIRLDSTGNYVEIIEKIGDHDTKIRLKLTIDEYIKLKLAFTSKQRWEELAYKYEGKLGKKELGDLISSLTNIDIPIPKNPILSIFGEPKINLRINGQVDIRGAWRNETTEGITASRLGNTRNEPDFKQDVQINISGTIGDKLNITANWNTQNTFEYENQLKLKYTGYQDEIIQTVEAGNVSLQTAGLVGGGEALFGIKAKVQLGPLTLTGIASQKKGQTREKSLSGGSEAQKYEVRLYSYSKNHFFLDKAYADTNLNIFKNYYSNPTPLVNQFYTVQDIEVWQTVTGIVQSSYERQVNAYIDLPSKSAGNKYADSLKGDINESPGIIETGRFKKLDPADYILHPETGFITIKTQVQESDAIAVAYRIQGGANSLFYGEFVAEAQDTTKSPKLVLKLIKPKNLQPSQKKAWALQLKNIYSVGSRNIKKDGFTLDILYETPGSEPKGDINGIKLLNAFGLDSYDDANQTRPDGKFDFIPGKTIEPSTGEIIFPVLQPFGNNLPSSLTDSAKYQDIYDTLEVFARQNKVRDRFVITGKSSGDASSRYNLGFNLVENSVKIYLGGRELTPNVDYSMDYNTGQLIIRNETALLPNADLKISYEENDLFQLAAKTLLGLRGELQISKKTSLGFSLLNLNQQTLSDKVRIGEEPIDNTIMGIDAKTSMDLPFMTDLLNNVISTKEMSTFNLSGEAAYMIPDPNTKKSTILGDEGKSVAYIDDFEGAKRIIPIGVGYTTWRISSPPVHYDSTKVDSIKMNYKAKTLWYNVLPSDVKVQDIWPKKTAARGQEQITVMDVEFRPKTKAEYNYRPNLNNPVQSWGGFMKVLSSSANNLVQENIDYIEFWYNPIKSQQNGKMYIDIGKISEDMIPNGVLNTEDINRNGIIDQNEDLGIDGMSNTTERAFYQSTENDPSVDDFSYSYGSNDYTSINGTEGNAALTDAGRIPDTEDLNNNGTLDRTNSYFSYEISLNVEKDGLGNFINPYIVGGGGDTRWYQFRIPLRDIAAKKVGEPSLSLVEYVRMWFSGFSDSLHFRMTEFNFVGNQWQKVKPTDSLYNISVVNLEDNPDYYMPPGLQQEKDRSQTDQNVLKNEQSLSFVIDNLKRYESKEIIKVNYKPLDLFNYKELKLFVHGTTNPKPNDLSYFIDDTTYTSEIYFRFGVDTNNYYEYREPVKPDWNEIKILFSEITSLKQLRDSIGKEVEVKARNGNPNAYFRVKGNPSLTAVSIFLIGLKHASNKNIVTPIIGNVWFNELRLLEADNAKGWALSANASLKIADFINLTANFSETSPFFHALEQRFGSRTQTRAWGVSFDVDLVKLLPNSMRQSNLRFNYSHTENVSNPEYVPGTDIKISDAAEQLYNRLISDTLINRSESEVNKTVEEFKNQNVTINTSDTYSLQGIKIKIPTEFWLINDTWNNLVFSFNYNKSFSRNVTTKLQENWVWNFSTSYTYTFMPDNFFRLTSVPYIGEVFELFKDLKEYRLFYLPSNIGWNFSTTRNKGTIVSRTDPLQPNISRDFKGNRSVQLGWKFSEGGFLNPSFVYSLDYNSTYAFLETDYQYGYSSFYKKDTLIEVQRREKDIWNSILKEYFFGKDFSFRESFDFRTNPRLPSLFDMDKFINITASYSATYQWGNDFRQSVLGRSVGNSNNITLGLNLRLKQLMEPLFGESGSGSGNTQAPFDPRRREFSPQSTQGQGNNSAADSTQMNDTTSTGISIFSKALTGLNYLKAGIKYILFDYENITINLNQTNNSQSSGIEAEASGITNFWNFFTPNRDKMGPSRSYQLGLSSDPGRRAPGGNLSDIISQRNNLDLRTSRPLWEGARVDINWKVGWSKNENTSIKTDSLGVPTILTSSKTGTIDRSFLTMPDFLIFSVFKNGIKKVNELYNPGADNPNENLSVAFEEGFETMSLLSGIPGIKEIAAYIPRPNWSFNWDGLERLPLLESVASRVSLSHAYTSSVSRAWKTNPDGAEETQSQKVMYGFQPILGLNITFKQLWSGNISANIKFGSNTSYDLSLSTKNISETFAQDIGISASYSKSGFELPFFGLSLKNDIEISLSYTQTKNSVVIFDMQNFKEGGTPQDGNTRTTLEPRIRYNMSQRVTLSFFYKRSSVAPEGASRIPPTTTNEAGINVNITI